MFSIESLNHIETNIAAILP